MILLQDLGRCAKDSLTFIGISRMISVSHFRHYV